MKNNDTLTLPRLLERRETAALLQALADSMTEEYLALVRADGKLFSSTSNCTPEMLTHMQAVVDASGWLKATNNQRIDAAGFRLYPLMIESAPLGLFVAYGKSPNPEYPLERALHQTLELMMSQALGKREMANEALERYREINLIYRVSETIGASFNVDAIPSMVLAEGNHVIHADAGVVLMPKSAADTSWEVKASFGVSEQIPILGQIAQAVAAMPNAMDRPAILSELPIDGSPFGAVLWAPLNAQKNTLGGVLLARSVEQAIFTASDEKLLMALARQAAVAADNTRLHNEMVEQERFKRELQLARNVQSSLIPRNVPRVLNWDFAAYWHPAREVGGDFYDFIRREKRQMGLVLGDVSDKGMHAALFMALTRSTMRASTLGAHTPMVGLNRANRLLCADSTGGMFVTLFYGQLDPVKNELTYVNAGHNPPLLYRAAEQRLIELKRTGIMLGFDDTFEYHQATVKLDPGDFVFCYTDGVTELVNGQEEQYGEERLYQLLLDHPTASPDDLLQVLLASLEAFRGDALPFDDVTVLIAKRLG